MKHYPPLTLAKLVRLGFIVLASVFAPTAGIAGIVGAVYGYAQPDIVNPANVGSVHINDVATTTLAVTNTNKSADPLFQESLDASFGTTTGSVNSTAGSISLLPAGQTNNSSMVVGIDTSTAGAKTGTVKVNLVSDGQGTSGLGNTPLPSQTITVNGNVYDYANAGYASASGASLSTVSASNYKLDFGDIPLDHLTHSASLNVLNNNGGALSDSLRATSSSISAGSGFVLTGIQPGFTPFTLSGVEVQAITAAFVADTLGLQHEQVALSWNGVNPLIGSGYVGQTSVLLLDIYANVVAGDNGRVPEPGTFWLLGIAAVGWKLGRKRLTAPSVI
jgi:hypothetical protein